jgi:hypothetical protein
MIKIFRIEKYPSSGTHVICAKFEGSSAGAGHVAAETNANIETRARAKRRMLLSLLLIPRLRDSISATSCCSRKVKKACRTLSA